MLHCSDRPFACVLWCPSCKELFSLVPCNPFLTLVVSYLTEFSVTPLQYFKPITWNLSSSYSPDNWGVLFPYCCMLLTAQWEVLSLDLITLKTFHCFCNQNRMLDHTAVLMLGWSHWKTTAIHAPKVGSSDSHSAVRQLRCFLSNNSRSGHRVTNMFWRSFYIRPNGFSWTVDRLLPLVVICFNIRSFTCWLQKIREFSQIWKLNPNFIRLSKTDEAINIIWNAGVDLRWPVMWLISILGSRHVIGPHLGGWLL